MSDRHYAATGVRAAGGPFRIEATGCLGRSVGHNLLTMWSSGKQRFHSTITKNKLTNLVVSKDYRVLKGRLSEL